MKKTKKLFRTCFVAMAMVVALTMAVPTNVNAAAKIKLNKKTVTLAKTGKTVKLKLKNAKVTKKNKIKWKTSNKKVATVTSTGKVTAVKKGSCTITATYKGKKYKCKVKVKKTVKTVEEKNIKISKTGIGFEKVGMTETLTLVNAKPDASNKITWKSSNTKVATVTNAGEVTAVKKGSCTITATYKGKEYKCKVFVVKKGSTVTDIEYTKKGVKTTVEIYNADGHHIRWFSTNTAVAKVETQQRDNEGYKIGTKAVITSVAPGRCQVTAHDITVDTVWQNNKKVAEEQLALGNEWDWHLYGWTYYSDKGGPATNPKSTDCKYTANITFYPECGYFTKPGWETEAEKNPKYEPTDALPDFKKTLWLEVE